MVRSDTCIPRVRSESGQTLIERVDRWMGGQVVGLLGECQYNSCM